jgi:hypothetical protein
VLVSAGAGIYIAVALSAAIAAAAAAVIGINREPVGKDAMAVLLFSALNLIIAMLLVFMIR